MGVKRASPRWAAAILAFSIILGLAAVSSPARAEYGTFNTLYSFCPTSDCLTGWHPYGAVILDKQGNVYGTTLGGGTHVTDQTLYRAGGVAFVLGKSNNFTETDIANLCAQANCADGLSPGTALAMDSDGSLYGTTEGGGAVTCGTVGGKGCGAAFRLVPNAEKTVWTYTKIHEFTPDASNHDGRFPAGTLLIDKDGDLIGTTPMGGTEDEGTVFILKPNKAKTAWTETILYNFCSVRVKKTNLCRDGGFPLAGVVADKDGNLYGTTQQGGVACDQSNGSCGTVYMLTLNKAKTKGTLTTLHFFCASGKSDCDDGFGPQSQVIVDPDAKEIYGTTWIGPGSSPGNGTVFRMTRIRKAKWTEEVIFTSDVYSTLYSGVIEDGDGNLFGVSNENANTSGAVFELSPNKQKTKWTPHILHEFCPAIVSGTCPDGSNPIGQLVMDKKGNLYGTTFNGGVHQGDGGSVFELVK